MRYTEMVLCRVSAEDKKSIMDDINDNYPNMSISDYVRNKVLDKPMDFREVIVLITELKYEMNRIGNNLNQIARKINSGDYVANDLDKIFQLQNDMNNWYEKLLEIELSVAKARKGKDGNN